MNDAKASQTRYGDGHWTLSELQILIQSKINERTSRATVEKQDAYKLFGQRKKYISICKFVFA